MADFNGDGKPDLIVGLDRSRKVYLLIGTTASVMASTPGAVYTGLALGNNTLFAANFAQARIDVFNSTFAPTTVPGGFTDPTLPGGFSPYNIQNINGRLYVEYAQPGPGGALKGAGLGVVRVFNLDGTLAPGAPSITAGPLNAPWGVTLAPSNFGEFSGDLLVGNFGDGTINAFNPTSGAFIGTLMGSSGPIVNSGLWALATRATGPGIDPNALYFTAGINSEADGLFGELVAAPEPGSVALAVAGLLAFVISKRHKA